jgi:hypothetical protein
MADMDAEQIIALTARSCNSGSSNRGSWLLMIALRNLSIAGPKSAAAN